MEKIIFKYSGELPNLDFKYLNKSRIDGRTVYSYEISNILYETIRKQDFNKMKLFFRRLKINKILNNYKITNNDMFLYFYIYQNDKIDLITSLEYNGTLR